MEAHRSDDSRQGWCGPAPAKAELNSGQNTGPVLEPGLGTMNIYWGSCPLPPNHPSLISFDWVFNSALGWLPMHLASRDTALY